MPRFVISTSGVDRAGDRIAVAGWRFDAFLRNPVVLWAHDSKALPIGRVTSISRTADSVVADIEFDTKDPLARQIAGKVADGLLSACSVGFRPLKWTRAESKDRPFGIDFSETELLELSVVSVPANPDATVIARKSFFEGNAVVNKIMELRRQSADLSDAIDVQSTPELVNELAGIDAAIKSAEAEQARKAASAVRQAAQLGHPVEPGNSDFSLSRLIAGYCGLTESPELEVCKNIARLEGVGKGIKIPFTLAKAQTVGSGSAGGFLSPDYQSAQLIGRLTANSLVSLLPLTRLAAPAGTGALNLPRVASGTSGAWLGETATVPESGLTLGMITMTPRMAGLRASFSRMLMAMSSPSIENVVIRDLQQSLVELIDNALLNGAGVGNAPLGVLSQGVPLAESSYANLWTALAAAVKTLESANSGMSAARWLVSPATAARLRTEFKSDPTDAINGEFISIDGPGLMGLPVVTSSYCPDATAVLANWSDVILAQWGSADLLIDPYTQAEQGLIRVVLYLMVDVALRHSESLITLTLSS